MNQEGFTLLELLVVCALISIMLLVSVPAFRNTLFNDPLRQAARKITGTIREARQNSVAKSNGCYLEINLDDERIGYLCPDPPQDRGAEDQVEKKKARMTGLPPQVRFTSVWHGSAQNVSSGKVSLWINSRGLMDQTIINITDGEREMALVSSVFLPDLILKDGAMSPEDIENSQ